MVTVPETSVILSHQPQPVLIETDAATNMTTKHHHLRFKPIAVFLIRLK